MFIDQIVTGEWHLIPTAEVDRVMAPFVENDGLVISGQMRPWPRTLYDPPKPDLMLDQFYAGQHQFPNAVLETLDKIAHDFHDEIMTTFKFGCK